MKIGILGAGQLGRMLALAGIPLGLSFVFYDPNPRSCAAQLGNLYAANYDDETQLRSFAQEVDLITYEFENIPVKAVELLSTMKPVKPGVRALYNTQDRLLEKRFFQKLKIPVVDYLTVDSREDVEYAARQLGYPFVIKSRNGGYDGKGQKKITSEKDLSCTCFENCIAERWVSFSRELSIIATRDELGNKVFYDVSENIHKNGILLTSMQKCNDPCQKEAESLISKVMDDLAYCGTFALELFSVEGKLIANEYAPRVHNTGHLTIEGAEVSQFENHLRAILGWKLGATKSLAKSAMVNCIGMQPDVELLQNISHGHYHRYGKEERSGRKLGHITLRCFTSKELDSELKKICESVVVK